MAVLWVPRSLGKICTTAEESSLVYFIIEQVWESNVIDRKFYSHTFAEVLLRMCIK